MSTTREDPLFDRVVRVILTFLVLATLLMAALPLHAAAVLVPPMQPPADPVEAVGWITKLISSGQWPGALGAVIFLLLSLVRKFEALWKDTAWAKRYAPLIGLAFALLVPLGGALIAGQGVVQVAITVALGLLGWVSSMGMNEAVNAVKSVIAWIKKDPAPALVAATKPVMKSGAKNGSLNLADLKELGWKVLDNAGKPL